MSKNAHILPKLVSESSGETPTDKALSRRSGKLTKIACYACRRRKCKCDGEQPTCGPCEQRGVQCDFDSVSGSASTQELKSRIRGLEVDNRGLAYDNEQIRAQNRQLHAENQHFRRRILEMPTDSGWSMSDDLDGFSASGSQQLATSPFPSAQPQGSPMTDVLDTMSVPGGSEVVKTEESESMNRALEDFLNGRRRILSGRRMSSQVVDSVLPPLDVTSLFNPMHMPEELSWWAMKLPMANQRMTLISKLADAYVTYHQLRWLILADDESAMKIPEFIRTESLSRFCIPHPVDIYIFADEDVFTAPIVSVTDSPKGFSPTGTPLLMSSIIIPWPKAESEATHCDQYGKWLLTPAFEAYVQDSNNWTAGGSEDATSRKTSFDTGQSMNET